MIQFTARENSILTLLGNPKSRHDNKYMSSILQVTPETLKIYIYHLMKKTNLDRIGLAILGYEERRINENPFM